MIDLDEGDVLDLELMTSVLHCRLCRDQLNDALMLPCQHTFCKQCLETRYAENKATTPRKTIRALSCPTCSTAAMIPAGGVVNYPECISYVKTRLLVNQLLMQTIISKVGKPRYFNDRDRSDSCNQTEGTCAVNIKTDSGSLITFPPRDISNSTCFPKVLMENKECQTDDFFASLADMKGESDKRSEPDGGSFTNQNVREIGVGENEHAIVFEEWSMDTDNEDKPASVLFCNKGNQLLVSDYSKKTVILQDLQTSDILYRIDNLQTIKMTLFKDNEMLILDCIGRHFSIYDISTGSHLYDLGDKIVYDRPGGICVNQHGHILIADSITGKINSYKDGTLLLQFKTAAFVSTSPGLNELQTNCNVMDLGCSQHTGKVACVERNSHRVVIYSEDGEVCQVIGGKGRHDGELLWPTSCVFQVNENLNNLLITDSENYRVSVFTLQDNDYYFARHILQSLRLPPISISSYESKIAVSFYNRPGKSKIAIYNCEIE